MKRLGVLALAALLLFTAACGRSGERRALELAGSWDEQRLGRCRYEAACAGELFVLSVRPERVGGRGALRLRLGRGGAGAAAVPGAEGLPGRGARHPDSPVHGRRRPGRELPQRGGPEPRGGLDEKGGGHVPAASRRLW